MLAASGALLLSIGCGPKVVEQPEPRRPGPTFRGPNYLRGTVGSMTQLRGYNPLLVSGYGLVVGLPGTGSGDVPSFLERWMINRMRKKGLGSIRQDARRLTPERVLSSENTALVRVDGLIPPGAVEGTRFDVLVTALPQTQTTSLRGGRLWTTDLAIQGTNKRLRFSKPLAKARGDTYLDPKRKRKERAAQADFRRRALVVGGGNVSRDRRLSLVLNQPSWRRSRRIADRINERFGKVDDSPDIANAKTDTRIRLHIPSRYGQQPKRLLELISHLFVDRGRGMEQRKARRLKQALRKDPARADAVARAWTALGRTALPEIRPLYDAAQRPIRMAAVEAGARLEDPETIPPLKRAANEEGPGARERVARMLGNLPEQVRASRLLQELVDDDHRAVRLAAADALARTGDPAVQRVGIRNRQGPKFVLNLIRADEPLIYVRESGLPRMTVFGLELGFSLEGVARIWDNRLMLRPRSEKEHIQVFYQAHGSVEGETYQIAPTVPNLVFLLGHQSRPDHPTDGLDLSYSEVAHALNQLSEQGAIDAPVAIRESRLAQAVEKARSRLGEQRRRPETSPLDGPGPAVAPGLSGSAATQPADEGG